MSMFDRRPFEERHREAVERANVLRMQLAAQPARPITGEEWSILMRAEPDYLRWSDGDHAPVMSRAEFLTLCEPRRG